MVGRERAPVVGNGVAAELAVRLRSLRDASGINLRQLADRTGYSRAVLSTAESGRRTPSWSVIAAFITACGGVDAEWRQLWELATGQWAHADCAVRFAEAGRPDLAPPHGPGREPDPAPDQDTAPAPPNSHDQDGQSPTAVTPGTTDAAVPGRRRPKLVMACAVAAVAVAALVAFAVLNPSPRAATPAPVAATTYQRQMDGKDPYATGCRPDAVRLGTVGITFPDGRSYGKLTLMYSASCQASWGYVDGPNSHAWAVHIVAVRPADHADVPSVTQADDKPGSWGNMASTRPGCVSVEAWLTEGGRNGPRARTVCIEGEGPVVRGTSP